MMTSTGRSSVIEGLPKQFVTSLRILFDILDEDRSGVVRLCDIETRWHDEGVKGLPSGVVDSLRKVAPRNGKLTFENFVTGLKLSLLQPGDGQIKGSGDREKLQLQDSSISSATRSRGPYDERKTRRSQSGQPPVQDRSLSQNYMTQPDNSYQHRNNGQRQQKQQTTQQNIPRSQRAVSTSAVPSNTAKVQPNNVLQSQNHELRSQIYNRDQLQHAVIKDQSKSEPPALPYRDTDRRGQSRISPTNDSYSRRMKDVPSQKTRPKSAEFSKTRESGLHSNSHTVQHHAANPARPPPYRKKLDEEPPPAIPPRNIHGRIMHELRNWQREQKSEAQVQRQLHTVHSDSKLTDNNRFPANNIYVNIEQIRKHASDSKTGQQQQPQSPVRRQNSRRHTLSSGIDYNVIRRMKQLEQEKDTLLQGLEVVDRTREWYLKQIAAVTEKQTRAEKTSCNDVTLQADQERMDFVRGRITDVNLNLKSLMESSQMGFPAHMNLAVRSNVYSEESSVRWLKEQNKQLTKEVGSKSEKITQLEKEKASLIRDLFESRSKHKNSYDDTTFM